MDRVSSLPEELLCHVLSFLTTKEASLTSILSKRCRYLFAFVPNLKFDNSVFLHDPEESNREKKKGIRQSFVDFVDRVLALQGDSTIEKFSLKCKTGAHKSARVNQWICNVLQRGVLDMDLSIDLGQERCMFVETFMSTTLVELKLGSGCRISFRPGLISLPMLKTLTLVDSGLSDSGQLQMLLSACPALEALDLTNVRWCYADATVSSASLKTLTIGSANSLHTLSFDTPNLLCLNHSALVREDYPLVNLEKLVEAHIKLDRGISMYDNVPKLLSGICSVQKLYLSPGTLEVLGLCCQAMPVFNNLTFLDIESNMNISWKAMPVLLKNCPHLETLVMKGGLVHCITDYCGDACTCKSRKEKGRSLTSCPVKRLEIREFQGRSIEMDMIKHFLDYFPCLKEMEIYVEDGRPEHLAPITFDSPYNHLSGRNVKIKVHDSLT